MLLVDSSVWIAAQNPRSSECKALRSLLLDPAAEELCTSPLIHLEVSQGAIGERQFQVLWDGFLGLRMLPLLSEIYYRSATNYFRCRKKGIALSTIDCLIATTAQHYGVRLWSKDRVFTRIAPLLGLELGPA